MPFTLQTQLRTNPDVVVTELTDRDGKPEAVLLNLSTQKYFSLNATGIRIWKVLEQRQPLAAAVSDLTGNFDVSAERAEASVLSLAEALSEARLVMPLDEAV